MTIKIVRDIKLWIIVLLLLQGSISSLKAQSQDPSFEVMNPSNAADINADLELGQNGFVVFYDMDNDGDKDILQYSDTNSGVSEANVYRNDGDGHFEKTDTSYDLDKIHALGLNYPVSAQGDLNGDGINDLVVGGPHYRYYKNSNPLVLTHIYWGTQDAGLIENTAQVLPSATKGDISVVDINQDTYLDIFITGSDPTNRGAFLYLNDGNGVFTEDQSISLDFSFAGAHAISPAYDGGKRDIIISGYNGSFAEVTALYQYDGAGNFNLVSDSFFPAFYYGHHQFADADADGDKDLLLEGTIQSDTIYYHQLYINEGNGVYSLSTVNLDTMVVSNRLGSIFTDLDGDGAAEIIMFQLGTLIGNSSFMFVLKNNGSGEYVDRDSYEGLRFGQILSVGDLNGDGYKDIFHNGYTSGLESVRNWYFINDQTNGFVKQEFNLTEELSESDLKFSDIDRDGDLDLMMAGWNIDEDRITSVYTNDGLGNYELDENALFPGVRYASLDFADVDDNGFEDVLLTGLSDSDVPIANLYLNNNGLFTLDTGTPFIGIGKGQAKFFDADGDDDQDVLLVGLDASDSKVAQLYINDGTGNFTTSVSGIDGVSMTAVAIGDVDGNMTLDVLLSGLDDSDLASTKLYINDGIGNFTEDVTNSFIDVSDGHVALQDLDDDDDLDLLIGGSGDQVIYKNDGSGTFNFFQQLDGLHSSAASFADVDLDGDLDFVVSGSISQSDTSYAGATTILYLNDGEGSFSKSESTQFHGIRRGGVAFADIDGDFDDDLIITGNSHLQEGNVARFYRNTICISEAIELQQLASCEVYDFYGTQLSATGTYQHNFLTEDGCNRLVSLDFTFQGDNKILNVEACESYEFDGSVLTTSGQYISVFTNQSSCDSLVTLNLKISEPDEVEAVIDGCGDYQFGTKLLTESGVYDELFTNQSGCDSLVTLTFGKVPEPIAEIEVNGVVLFAEEQSGATYRWYDCDTEEPIGVEDQPQLTPPTTGNYYVEVSNGVCTATSECVFFDWVLSAQENKAEARVFPTLTPGSFTIDLGESLKQVEVRILSLGGDVLFNEHFNSFRRQTLQINGERGLYFVQVAAYGELIHSQRIIKK
ncbi:MAG: VCBS repeat-containing protein [Reichenbachiella sp.]|uniref:FG-GAP repeat domain-containing protein n=1 Tax=Reichenbachiella sp. TaxID=2184521 RepID=UPI0032647887